MFSLDNTFNLAVSFLPPPNKLIISLCSSIAEKRQTIPILSNVLLKTNDGNLTIVATDLERQLSLIVSDCSISEDGETTVSARKLFELIRSVPDDTELNFEVIENQLEISALSFQADLAVLPVQDFPFVDPRPMGLISHRNFLFWIPAQGGKFRTGISLFGYHPKGANSLWEFTFFIPPQGGKPVLPYRHDPLLCCHTVSF